MDDHNRESHAKTATIARNEDLPRPLEEEPEQIPPVIWSAEVDGTLRGSEQRLALALSGTRVGIYDRDIATGECFGTEQVAYLLGLRTTTTTLSQSYHYRQWAQRVHPEDLPRVEIELRRCIAERVAYETEYRVVWPTGNQHWIAERGVFQCDAEGRPAHMLGIVLDITDRKLAEKSLEEANHRLQAQADELAAANEQLLTQKEELQRQTLELQEIKEALRVGNATLEVKVAQQTADLRQRARQLQKLALELSQTEERERKRLAEILHDDLQQQLAAAKFHLGLVGKEVREGDASLREVVDQTVGIIKEAIEQTRRLSREFSPVTLCHGDLGETLEWLASQMQANHGLTVRVEVQGPVVVSSDAIKMLLFRTAQEILFNAVKHAGVAEATVRLRQRDGRLWMSIGDRGRGFDLKILKQTAGLGLLSVRERIELLGGRMRVRSAAGKGSTFSVVVPDGQSGEDGRRTTADDATQIAPSSVLRVVLADDHDVVRQGLASLLSEGGAIQIVGEAANGRDAVDLTNRLHPDVVIMDVSMPVMSGEEATRQIKQDLPQTRIVVLSMWEEPDVRKRMRAAGAESYLLKTTPYKELLAALRGESPIDSHIPCDATS